MGSGDREVIARVDDCLTRFLDERAAALAEVGPELAEVAQAARAIVLDGGKRLRPRFAYWGWRCTRDEPPQRFWALAASLELLHAAALVHDDLIDASATRRGRPAAHEAFAAMHAGEGWSGTGVGFGSAAAIVLGDLLLSWADDLLDLGEPDRATRRAFSSMRELVMAGQYLDVLVQARGSFSTDDALRVIAYKTSKYTVEGPLLLGAAAAGAPDDVVAALRAYAAPVGEAFQLRDDVLGVWGDPLETGKPAGDDLREGKRTLLVAHAMAHATAGQAATLRAGVGQAELSAEQVHELREVLVATGALDEVERVIAERTTTARAGLRDAPVSTDARAALDALAVASTARRI